MIPLWWQMPGPACYVSCIVDSLRQGKNVAVLLPEHHAEGLRTAVRETIGDSWTWHVLKLNENENHCAIDLLYSRFAVNSDNLTIRDVDNLLKQGSFAGRIIWIESISINNWQEWKEFIAEYEHACRNISILERTLFCLPLVGELALDPPKEDVCLVHHRYYGVADSLDSLLFTSTIFRNTRLSDIQKRLVIAIVAHLSLWDPAMAERFTCEKFERILEPLTVLAEFAKNRDWDTRSSLWHCGMHDIFEGKPRFHSAALVCHDPTREIERRLWSAQTRVLFPLVEEIRRQLLVEIQGLLRVPYTTRFGDIITDIRDLEIGHIEAQLANRGMAEGSEFRRIARTLRKIRNCLSHLEPIKADFFANEDVTCIFQYLE